MLTTRFLSTTSVVFLSCALIFAESTRPVALSDTELVSKLQVYLEAESTRGSFSGAVIIAKDGQPIFEKAYGFASKEYKTLNNVSTKFDLGSICKVFTRIAIGQLVAQGKISIDEKIGTYLPDYPNQDAAANVTVWQLVNMQSGIGDFFGPEFEHTAKDRFRAISTYRS